MAGHPEVELWSAWDLLERLERRGEFFVLDVRNREEFSRFRIEGRSPVPSVNVPYFEILELGGQDDMMDSIVAYAERDLAPTLPADLPILVVCAKGDTSLFVAEALRRLGFAGASLEGGMKAWGDHYAARPVVEEPGLAIYQVSRPARGCLSYVASGDGRAIVIDALRHLHPYLELARAKGFTIEMVIDTHGHADHISGGRALASATGASYYLHPYDGMHPIDVLPATIPYEFLRDGQRFPLGRRQLEALHVPGHTLGMVAFRLDDRFLFSGDSIFLRSISRPDLGGKAEAWARLHARSLRKLLELPDRIAVLPGHFSGLDEADESGRFAASLEDLKQRNDGLVALERLNEEGFVRYLIESLPAFVPEYVEIKRVNAGLLAPNEEDAATLELGKNACALAQAYAAASGGQL